MKILKIIYNKIRLTLKINSLDIRDYYVDSNLASIKYDGNIFYGYLSRKRDHKYYNIFLRRRTRVRLSVESYNLALNIIIRYCERKMQGCLKELYYKIKPGDTVVEVGAYLGHYTMYLSQQVGDKGRVIAIEPMKDNIEILEKNVHNFENVSVCRIGVYNTPSWRTLIYQNKNDKQSASLVMGETSKDTIHIDTLDNILKQITEVDFMIIQTNGAELQAIEGLTTIKPKNMVIASRYGGRWEIMRILKERGYNVTIKKGKYIYANLKI